MTFVYPAITALWGRVLLQKPTATQSVKEFLDFHETKRFNTASTTEAICPYHEADQSSPCPPTLTSTLIVSSHLSLGLPKGIFHSRFLTKILNAPLNFSMCEACPTYLILRTHPDTA